MSKRTGNIINNNSKKTPLLHQNGSKSRTAQKTMASRRRPARDRKIELLKDVDNLKKKLRHEENVHRALQRAFKRPLGTLPRLPPYLPQYTLELLAEVAVLEEEVVRLEEQIVSFRQGLYQEAVCISSRKSPEDQLTSFSKNEMSVGNSRQRHSRSSSQSDVNFGSFQTRPLPSFSRVASIRKMLPSEIVSNGLRHSSESPPNHKQPQNEQSCVASENELGRENGSSANSYKDSKPNAEKKTSVVKNPVRGCPLKHEVTVKRANSPKMQCRIVEQAHESSSSSSDDRVLDINSEANKLSEDILKCLINIFVRLSLSKGKTMNFESFSSLARKESGGNNVESNYRDPYCSFLELKKRDIGTYEHLYVVEARSFDLKRKTNASFLIQRLKILLDKLSCVRLDGLSHQQKLAFWINIYNSCIMNTYLDHGIPDSPDNILVQMQKARLFHHSDFATIKVGGHTLNAVMIEQLILRLPYHLKFTCLKSSKNDIRTICRTLGLEWSEPLVTFALSCGSWSSPAVRVYNASQIETELEAAKRDYLQAAIGISSLNKIVIPKLLDWYLLDFAKNLDSFLDWICLQLPDELRNEAVKCLEMGGKQPRSELVQVMPYNFSFRYLIHR
ncbi:hypothetical protein OROHE_002400 [Orobanche hederae]